MLIVSQASSVGMALRPAAFPSPVDRKDSYLDPVLLICQPLSFYRVHFMKENGRGPGQPDTRIMLRLNIMI